MAVSVSGKADNRSLEVVVYPRVWSKDPTKFDADYNLCGGKDCRGYSLPIDSWSTPPQPANSTSDTKISKSDSAPTNDKIERRLTMDPGRTLAHRFLSLPFVSRMNVAHTLNLLKDEDEGLQEIDRSKRIFTRAKEGRLLAQLWDEVERRHADGRHQLNPFQK